MSVTLKDERIALRLTGDQKALITAAADMLGSSVTDFAVQTTLARATEVLADQRIFHVSEARSAEFERLLNAPVQPNQGLADLFSKPSVLVPR